MDPASQALLLTELSFCSVAVESTESFREIRLPSCLGSCLSIRDSVDLPVFQRKVVKTLEYTSCKITCKISRRMLSIVTC